LPCSCSAGSACSTGTLSDREFEREARRLERPELLNPDPTWRLNLGLALLERNPRRAVRELERVVDGEPDNVTAWKILRVAPTRRPAHGARGPRVAR